MTSKSQVQSTIRRVLDDKRDMQWALRPIFHDMQDALGHVPTDADMAETLQTHQALLA